MKELRFNNETPLGSVVYNHYHHRIWRRMSLTKFELVSSDSVKVTMDFCGENESVIDISMESANVLIKVVKNSEAYKYSRFMMVKGKPRYFNIPQFFGLPDEVVDLEYMQSKFKEIDEVKAWGDAPWASGNLIVGVDGRFNYSLTNFDSSD